MSHKIELTQACGESVDIQKVMFDKSMTIVLAETMTLI